MRSKVFKYITQACYCTLILLSAPVESVAQTEGIVTVSVIDQKSRRPIPYVEGALVDRYGFILADDKGMFTFPLMENGTASLVVSIVAYEAENLFIQASGDTAFTIELVPLSYDLTEVVVQQQKEVNFALKKLRPVEGTAIYEGKKSEVVLLDLKVGNMASNNARQIYSQVAGLNIYENGDAGLQLNVGGRGLDPNRTANFNTRQNGYDISADVLGYPESYYTPPAEALREIQVVRGAASLQYGTQFGGLINFRFKDPVPTKALSVLSRQTVGSFGLFTSFNSLSGTYRKWSYYSFVNLKMGNGFRPNSEFASLNSHLSVHFQPISDLQITGELTHLRYKAQQAGGLTDAQFKEDIFDSNRSRNWFSVNWLLAAFKLEHRITPKTTYSLTAHWLDADRGALGFRGDPLRPERNPITESDLEEDQPRDLIFGEFNNWSVEGRFLHRYRILGRRNTALIGSKYYKARNTSQQGPGASGSDLDLTFRTLQYPSYPNQSNFLFPNENLAFFGENIFRLNDRFAFTPGFRAEYIHTRSEGEYTIVRYDNAGNEIYRNDSSDNRNLKRQFLLLGVGSSYNLKNRLQVYANFSENYRSVTFSDIRVVNPTFIIDPLIRDESGYTTDAGIRGRVNDVLTLDLSGYIMRYNDRIGTVLVESGPNKGDRLRKNIGDAKILGLEAFSELNLRRLTDMDSSKYKLNAFVNLALTHSEYIESEESNVVGKSVEFVPAANLKTGLRFGYKNLTGSLQYTYLSEQFTDAENNTAALEGDSREGIIGEIPAYDVWDLSLAYRIKRFRVECGINNVMDRYYFTRRATGYPGPGIIPSEPRSYYLTLGVEI